MVEKGDSLQKTLQAVAEPRLRKLISALADGCTNIAAICRVGHVDKINSSNAFGDEQLEIDVRANDVLLSKLRETGVVAVASSEEMPVGIEMTAGGSYSVAFDPLDGSSIIATNFAVGTIIGVWAGDTLVGVNGRSMVASVVAVYGPRTTLLVCVDGVAGVVEYTFDGESWVVSRVVQQLAEGKLFAPANLRCTRDNEGYRKLVEHYISEGYTLRYTGGMVPDVTQIIVKGYGVFTSPISEKAPAKLRLLYEALPMAHLIEGCGGSSCVGRGIGGSILDRTVGSYDERTAVCVGSRGQVDKFEKFGA